MSETVYVTTLDDGTTEELDEGRMDSVLDTGRDCELDCNSDVTADDSDVIASVDVCTWDVVTSGLTFVVWSVGVIDDDDSTAVVVELSIWDTKVLDAVVNIIVERVIWLALWLCSKDVVNSGLFVVSSVVVTDDDVSMLDEDKDNIPVESLVSITVEGVIWFVLSLCCDEVDKESADKNELCSIKSEAEYEADCIRLASVDICEDRTDIASLDTDPETVKSEVPYKLSWDVI